MLWLFGVTPACRTGNRSPLSAPLLIVALIAIPLADEGPDPIGRQARPIAMSALPMSHALMTLLRVCERGALEGSATDRMAATPAGCPDDLKISPRALGNPLISATLNSLNAD
jgi:hypothetical protein